MRTSLPAEFVSKKGSWISWNYSQIGSIDTPCLVWNYTTVRTNRDGFVFHLSQPKAIGTSTPAQGEWCYTPCEPSGEIRCHLASTRNLCVCPKSLPCGRVAGKSWMLVAILAVNSFRSPNGRYPFRPFERIRFFWQGWRENNVFVVGGFSKSQLPVFCTVRMVGCCRRSSGANDQLRLHCDLGFSGI